MQLLLGEEELAKIKTPPTPKEELRWM
uniref:Uncharacterized protein n=1 Tax=Rhizophora mucronata TaxID=61149 RepID=A0A2P2PKK3_RHIMU